jgi:hypothetical protein
MVSKTNLHGECILGFRSQIKKGGGFLSNVDGEFKGYEFTKRFKGEKKDGEWVYFVPSIHVDGADEPVDQHMFLGAAERYAISDDGQELTMEDESPVTFGFSTPFGRFMDSLLNAAEKAEIDIESELPDLASGEALNLETLVGRRFRVKQEVDEAGNAKRGKRKVKDKKTGKTVEYDRTNTVIEAILGEAKSGGKASSKSAGKKAKASDEDDLQTEAGDVLKDVLAKGAVNRKNLSLPVTKALMKNDNKDALKKIILDEEWQDEQDFIEVDKKGNISLTE